MTECFLPGPSKWGRGGWVVRTAAAMAASTGAKNQEPMIGAIPALDEVGSG